MGTRSRRCSTYSVERSGVTFTVTRDSRDYAGRVIDGLLLGGWKINAAPEKLTYNRQLLRLEAGNLTSEFRISIYKVGETGRSRPDERRIEITTTYKSGLEPLDGVADVVLGYDPDTDIFVGFDRRRLGEGGETSNATSFFNLEGLRLAERSGVVSLPYDSFLFGIERHAFFEPVRMAEYLFNCDEIHAGNYGGKGAFAGAPRRTGSRVLKAPNGAPDGKTIMLSRSYSVPLGTSASDTDVERAEKGDPARRKTSPQKLREILKRQEDNGIRGEEFVLDGERERLREAGRPDLAEQVLWVAQEDTSLGYDIHSFEADGGDRFVEVKSTSGGSSTFEMSANEWRVAKDKSKRYVIARVTTVNEGPSVTWITDPHARLENAEISRVPSVWKVTV